MKLPNAEDCHFDIDKYLNRIVPPSPLHRLPTPLSWWLGHRKTTRPEVGNLIIALWAFIGTFSGLTLVSGVFLTSTALSSYNPPLIIASFVGLACFDGQMQTQLILLGRNSHTRIQCHSFTLKPASEFYFGSWNSCNHWSLHHKTLSIELGLRSDQMDSWCRSMWIGIQHHGIDQYCASTRGRNSTVGSC